MTGPGYGVLAAFLAYAAALAWAQPLAPRRRAIVTVFVVVDAAVLWWLSRANGYVQMIVRDWMPAAQILFMYWLSGAFVRPPMTRVEAWLAGWDQWLFETLGLAAFVRRAPRAVLEALEGAYLSVYVVVPLGFAVVWFGAPTLDTHRYWTVVVAAEVICYAMLPWIRTRPPRATGSHAEIDRRPIAIRMLNLRVLQRGSIQANTVPSAHASGALATALMVAEYLPAPGLALAMLAFGIMMGSVVGRYHYAMDAVLGAAVALAVWAIA